MLVLLLGITMIHAGDTVERSGGGGESLDTLCERYRVDDDPIAPGEALLGPQEPCTLGVLSDRGILEAEDVWLIRESSEGVSFLRTPSQQALIDARRAYRVRVEAAYGVEPGADAVDAVAPWTWEDEPPETEYDDAVLLNIQPDGQGGVKQIFGADNRAQISTPYGYPFTKFVHYVLNRPTEQVEKSNSCSGVFLDATHVLTAAHCVFNTIPNWYQCANGAFSTPNDCTGVIPTAYGTDHNKGYVCIGNGPVGAMTWPPTWHFSEKCEFVEARYIPAAYIPPSHGATSQAINNDFAVLKLATTNFPGGMGSGRWMAMSSINSPSTLQTKTPVNHGYPHARPNGTANWGHITAVGGLRTYWARQHWSSGLVAGTTTTAKLKTSIDAGSVQSGSPIFYYVDNNDVYTGQAHYIIGLITLLNDSPSSSVFPNDWNGGPTVGRFRDFVLATLP